MNDKTRRQNILSILDRVYPDAKIALSYSSPWELLVAVILSAQCTDVMVNKVTKNLFKKYQNLTAYIRADPKKFEEGIKSTGFYHNKAKNILASAKIIQSQFSGNVPKTMEQILKLPGVARKTANVVLGNAYGVVEGIAVDTHVLRLSQRLRLVPLNNIGGKHAVFVESNTRSLRYHPERSEGSSEAGCRLVPSEALTLDSSPDSVGIRMTPAIPSCAHHVLPSRAHPVDYIKDASPLKIEEELMKTIPKSRWFTLTYQLIDHGRAICKAQNPHCLTCPLSFVCPVKR